MTTFNTQELDPTLAIEVPDASPFQRVGIVKPIDDPNSSRLTSPHPLKGISRSIFRDLTLLITSPMTLIFNPSVDHSR